MKKQVKGKRRKGGYALLYDIIIIALGIVVAVILSKLGAIDALVSGLRGYSIMAAFVAGLFFTSTFTIAPASVAIAHLAKEMPVPTLAFWGALGAVCGDLILFFFIRDRFTVDFMRAIELSRIRHFFHSFHFGFLKWLAPVVGALIIASPLPDELGISLLGMSKVKLAVLVPVSYVMNFLGIYFIVGFAQLVS
jgi:hypothetical protein